MGRPKKHKDDKKKNYTFCLYPEQVAMICSLDTKGGNRTAGLEKLIELLGALYLEQKYTQSDVKRLIGVN